MGVQLVGSEWPRNQIAPEIGCIFQNRGPFCGGCSAPVGAPRPPSRAKPPAPRRPATLTLLQVGPGCHVVKRWDLPTETGSEFNFFRRTREPSTLAGGTWTLRPVSPNSQDLILHANHWPLRETCGTQKRKKKTVVTAYGQCNWVPPYSLRSGQELIFYYCIVLGEVASPSFF